MKLSNFSISNVIKRKDCILESLKELDSNRWKPSHSLNVVNQILYLLKRAIVCDSTSTSPFKALYDKEYIHDIFFNSLSLRLKTFFTIPASETMEKIVSIKHPSIYIVN